MWWMWSWTFHWTFVHVWICHKDKTFCCASNESSIQCVYRVHESHNQQRKNNQINDESVCFDFLQHCRLPLSMTAFVCAFICNQWPSFVSSFLSLCEQIWFIDVIFIVLLKVYCKVVWFDVMRMLWAAFGHFSAKIPSHSGMFSVITFLDTKEIQSKRCDQQTYLQQTRSF